MNINRLEVSQIFDNVVSDIDLRVEQFIQDNSYDQALINEINLVREDYIKEARDCEAYNLSLLDGQVVRLSNEERVKRFCFLIESFTDPAMSALFSWRLVSTDMYLTSGQIICFQALINLMHNTAFKMDCFDKLFHCLRSSFSVCFLFKCF